jgi:hypothetical protein
MTVTRIERMLTTRGIAFVDAAIRGLASRLSQQGTLYVSGIAGRRLVDLFGGTFRVKFLGDRPGLASALKMLTSGMVKGMAALFLEMGLAARETELLDEFFADCRQYCPGLMEVMERLLPTYPCHARRRAQELEELERMLHVLGLRPGLVSEARRLTTALAELNLPSEPESAGPSLGDLIELITLNNPLRSVDNHDAIENDEHLLEMEPEHGAATTIG